MKILGTTRSLCPICFREIEAEVIEVGGKAVITKRCRRHGTFRASHIWDDPTMYTSMVDIFKSVSVVGGEIGFELTPQCNMRCPFCFVRAGERVKGRVELKKGEILKNIKNAKSYTVVFSGGEPTLREDLFDLIREVKKKGFRVGILTNGLKLNKSYVERLKRLNLDKVQLQFDALDNNTYQILRGQKCLDKKLNAISNLKKSKIHVNLFTMLAKNVNDGQIKDIIEFGARNSKTIRAVIFSSLCYEGRYDLSLKKMKNSEIMRKIEEQTGIKRRDFLECTKFSVLFFRMMENGIGTKNISPCDAVCYLYITKNRATPLNRLLDLSFAIRKLEGRPDMKKFLLSILNPLNFRKFIKRGSPLNLLIGMCFSILKWVIVGKLQMDFILCIMVTNFHDRYNVDLDFLDKCTIRAYDGKRFVPFCKKNILRNRDITVPLEARL